MTTATTRLPYRTGTKNKVLRSMARFAIRDQEALIEVYTPRFGSPDAEASEAIESAEANIADFKKFLKTLPTLI